LSIALENDDTEGQAWLYRRIAVAHGMAYRNDECLRDLRIALDLFERAGDTTAEASILGNIGALHAQAGRAREALAYALRSQEMFRRVDVPRGETLALGRIADALELAGDYEGAAEQHRRRIPLLRREARPTTLATALTNYGSTLKALGLRGETFAALDEALAIRYRLEDYGGAADCLVETARAHRHFGDGEAARRCWQASVDLIEAHGLVRPVQESLEGIAALDRRRNEAPGAADQGYGRDTASPASRAPHQPVASGERT
jgi:tetratricopeptide (TPR) repeat protein